MSSGTDYIVHRGDWVKNVFLGSGMVNEMCRKFGLQSNRFIITKPSSGHAERGTSESPQFEEKIPRIQVLRSPVSYPLTR